MSDNRQETCQHEVITALKDVGEYGSETLTDWDWCAGCGSIRRRTSGVRWSNPANGIPNLPAKLNDLRTRVTALEGALREIVNYPSLPEFYHDGQLVYAYPFGHGPYYIALDALTQDAQGREG